MKRDRSPPHRKTNLAKWVPPFLRSNSSFFVVSCLPFHFQTLLSCLCLACVVSPCVMRPNKPGPWALDKVKKRLRAEQVQRERLASERYRQAEDQAQVQESKTNQTVSHHSPLLLFLCFACLLLLLLVLVLSSVVLALAKK